MKHVSFFKSLLANVSVVFLPTKVSVLVGKVNVPVLTMVAMTGAVNVLLVSVSVVFLPTKVSVAVGRLNVPVFTIVAMTGAVNVLLVNVCVVVVPTRVVVSFGKVIETFDVCDDTMVVYVAVVPVTLKLIPLVLSSLSIIAVVESTNDLFVNVSTVFLPTKVSGPVGIVTAPPLLIEVIMGLVNVLLVNV